MKIRNKKSLRQQAEMYWDEYWNNYPYHPHEHCRLHTILPSSPRVQLDSPKLKKSKLYPKEYNFYSRCTKEWNKYYHIRPCRRSNKKMTEMSYIRCSRITNIIEAENRAFKAEERFYPEYRRYVYYW